MKHILDSKKVKVEINMNYEDTLKNLDDILRKCGYKSDYSNPNETPKCNFDSSAGADSNYCRNVDSDMINGFQDVEPMLLVTIAEILANAISGKLPINVLNAYGNFLQLISQIISTYNAQQQYQQSGPGRCYNRAYRNVTNPYFVNSSPTQSDGGEPVTQRVSQNKTYSQNNDEIIMLKREIENLKRQVEMLKRN